MCYLAVAMSTDYDSWAEEEAPVEWEELLKTFHKNVDNVKALYMDFGHGKEALVGHDTRQVCLETTTTYTLAACRRERFPPNLICGKIAAI